MTNLYAFTPGESPAVAGVERLLSAAPLIDVSGARPVVERAVWFCACVTMGEAPTWLICETPEGNITWCRMPDRLDIDDVVDVRIVTGGHVDPDEVLCWLEDPGAHSVFGDGSADPVILRDLGRRIRALPEPAE